MDHLVSLLFGLLFLWLSWSLAKQYLAPILRLPFRFIRHVIRLATFHWLLGPLLHRKPPQARRMSRIATYRTTNRSRRRQSGIYFDR